MSGKNDDAVTRHLEVRSNEDSLRSQTGSSYDPPTAKDDIAIDGTGRPKVPLTKLQRTGLIMSATGLLVSLFIVGIASVNYNHLHWDSRWPVMMKFFGGLPLSTAGLIISIIAAAKGHLRLKLFGVGFGLLSVFGSIIFTLLLGVMIMAPHPI